MSPAAVKPLAQRKRNRKRKRRAASSSSSDSSSSDSSSDGEATPVLKVAPTPKAPSEDSASSSESSDSSSDSSSDEEVAKKDAPRGRQQEKTGVQAPRQYSPSPSPPPLAIPSFLPSKQSEETPGQKEQEMKDKFRQFWMSSVADGFRDDLEEIRKEPSLGTSKLALLIDSLASGAETFTSDEMDVVLN